MHAARSRRVAGRVVACVIVLMVTACHGGGASSSSSPGASSAAVDVKRACTALADLERSSDALNGVDVADPDTSVAALTKAVDAYSAALLTFERVGPAELQATAATVRAEVIAHHFGQAIAARTAIDAWESSHCSS